MAGCVFDVWTELSRFFRNSTTSINFISLMNENKISMRYRMNFVKGNSVEMGTLSALTPIDVISQSAYDGTLSSWPLKNHHTFVLHQVLRTDEERIVGWPSGFFPRPIARRAGPTGHRAKRSPSFVASVFVKTFGFYRTALSGWNRLMNSSSVQSNGLKNGLRQNRVQPQCMPLSIMHGNTSRKNDQTILVSNSAYFVFF